MTSNNQLHFFQRENLEKLDWCTNVFRLCGPKSRPGCTMTRQMIELFALFVERRLDQLTSKCVLAREMMLS